MKQTLSMVVLGCLLGAPLAWAQQPLALHEVKTIFVEPMPHGLDYYLKQQLAKWGQVRVVAEREQADGVLSGAAESRLFVGRTNAGSTAEADVTLTDRRSGAAIWATRKGRGFAGWMFEYGVRTRDVAGKIVGQLKKDWEKSRRRP